MTTISEFLPAFINVESAEPKTERELEFELTQKAASGDIAAFEQIYWKYHRRVLNICLRMTKNTAEAEDVAQQVFLNLYRKIGTFRGDSAFATWLHRMTVNQTLMHFRTVKSRKEETTETGEMPEINFAASQKPARPNQIIDRLQIDEAIAQLPEGYRKVVVLHDIEGFEHEEIAQMLGCAVGTSKSQLHKARRKLRRALAAK